MKIHYVTFNQRADRSRYIAEKFGSYLVERILDVGCDKAVLKQLLPNVGYTGIDVGGTPDFKIDLDAIDRLPFENDAFASTVCSDVLEHLENLHKIFGELVRVSSRYVIISLPNNWANARRPIERGKGAIAHYGLPAERPADRHRWFFGHTEAVNFCKEQERRFPISIVEMIANDKPRAWPVRMLRRMRYGNLDRYLNRYAHTLWVVYRRTDVA